MQEQFNKASQLHQAGDFSKAEQIYRELLEIEPQHPVIHARMATLFQQLQRAPEALFHYDIAIQGLPQELQLINKAADLALRSADNERAKKWMSLLMAASPNDLALKEKFAGVLVSAGHEREALQMLADLVKNNPQNPNALNLRGVAYCRLGEIDRGYKSFQKAIRVAPGHLGVLRNLITYGKGRKEPLLEDLIPQLEKQIQSAQLPNEHKMNMAYIVFMYYEKTKPEKAFSYLKLGNDINREGYRYQHEDTQKMFGSLCSSLTKDLKEQCTSEASDDNTPIFILGMPRSGTTLIEQILDSHSCVVALGEIDDLRRAFENQSKKILDDSLSVEQRSDALKQVAYDYLSAVRARSTAMHVTDKMPYNFMLVGAIANAMPKAKIIHCTRDPQETCYSIYKQNFSGSHAYTNDLEELGQYYNLYKTMMTHWEAEFPGVLYEANYERLIRDPESEIRKLLEYCELDYEPQCMAFHKNKRAVRTASVAQVRQPIYKDAMKASAAVANQLKPLRDVLNSGQGGTLIH